MAISRLNVSSPLVSVGKTITYLLASKKRAKFSWITVHSDFQGNIPVSNLKSFGATQQN